MHVAARLVHLAAQGGRQALALVSSLHLPARAQPQVVDAVERARDLRMACRRARSAVALWLGWSILQARCRAHAAVQLQHAAVCRAPHCVPGRQLNKAQKVHTT